MILSRIYRRDRRGGGRRAYKALPCAARIQNYIIMLRLTSVLRGGEILRTI